VGPPAACCASLCISPTTSVGGEEWLGLLSLAELDLVSFFDWPLWNLDALVIDPDMCFKDHFLLSPLLAPGFLPWGTSSVCKEGFEALESISTSSCDLFFVLPFAELWSDMLIFVVILKAFVIFLLLDFMTLTFEEDIDSEVRKLCKLSFLDFFKSWNVFQLKAFKSSNTEVPDSRMLAVL
ncbi:hypothetical protein Tco_0896496, partial [Tanacetum coccineum]